MIGVALKGLLGRKLRATLTAFAIVLGVAMISGSFVLTDTLGKSFDGIYDESYEATDAVDQLQGGDQHGRRRPRGAGLLGRRAATRSRTCPASASPRARSRTRRRLVDEDGKPIGNADEGIALGVDAAADQSLNPLKLVTGEWPQRRRSDRDRQGDRRGAAASRSARPSARSATARSRSTEISGIVRFGSVDSIGGATISVFDLATAQRLFDKHGKLDLIRVGAKPGVSEAELIGQIEPLLSETTQVKSAAAQAAADSEDTQEGMSIIKYILLGFGGIALFVGSFVIANTLAITVAQRMRELATLRTLGASRRQVLGSVVLESVVIGARRLDHRALPRARRSRSGLKALLDATGIELPSSGLVFATRTIVVSLGVGTLIAVLASLRPAIRATRIEPIAAVREGAVMPASRFARYAVPRLGRRRRRSRSGSSPTASSRAGSTSMVRILSLVVGVLLLFVGVAMIASRVVRPLALRARRAGRTVRRRGREARTPERGAEPGADGLDRGRGDDRARPDHVRRRARPGRPHLVHERRRRALRRRLRRRRPATSRSRTRPPQRRPTAPGVEVVSEIRAAEAKLARQVRRRQRRRRAT